MSGGKAKLVLIPTIISRSFDEDRWAHHSQAPSEEAMQMRLFARTLSNVYAQKQMEQAFDKMRRQRSVSIDSEASSRPSVGGFLQDSFGSFNSPGSPVPSRGGRELPSKSGARRPKLTGLFAGLDDDEDTTRLSNFVRDFPADSPQSSAAKSNTPVEPSKLGTFLREFPSSSSSSSGTYRSVENQRSGVGTFLREFDGCATPSESAYSEHRDDEDKDDGPEETAYSEHHDDEDEGSEETASFAHSAREEEEEVCDERPAVQPRTKFFALTLSATFRNSRQRSLYRRLAAWRACCSRERLRMAELGHRDRERDLLHKSRMRGDDEAAVVSSSSSVESTSSFPRLGGWKNALFLVVRRASSRRRLHEYRIAWKKWRKLGDGRWYDEDVRVAHRVLFETHKVRQRDLLLRTVLVVKERTVTRANLAKAWSIMKYQPSTGIVLATPSQQQQQQMTLRRYGSGGRRVRSRSQQPSSRTRRRLLGSEEDAGDASLDSTSDAASLWSPAKADGETPSQALGLAARRLRRAALRHALSILRARCIESALGRERREKAEALAKLDANEFAAAELRELHAIAKEELESCHQRAAQEVDAAWRQAEASDSGHVAQNAAFAALQESTRNLASSRANDNALLELESMLIEAKLEIAHLKAAAATR